MSTKSYGSSGVISYNYNLLDDEYLNTLRFPNGSKIYDEMRRSDPQVKAVLQSAMLPLLKADYIIEPASDSPQDKAIAEFVELNLFPNRYKIKTKKGSKLNKTWNETIQEIALMIPFGYSVFEKIWTTKEGVTYLEKLSLRPAKTIKQFVFKTSSREELSYTVQLVNGIEKHIPADKSIIFTFQQEGNNLAGIALLRAMYKPWSIKQDLEKLRVMTFEKYGLGVPHAKTSLKPGTPAYSDLQEALENFGLNDSAYLITDEDTEIDLLAGGTKTAPDMESAIKYCDDQISVSGLAQFLNLGSTSSGNRALSESFIDFFYDYIEGIQKYISGKLNSEVVQELVDLNYSVTNYPVIKAVPPKDLALEIVAELVDKGVITADLSLENRIREELGVEEIKERPSPVVVEPEETEEEETEEVEASEHVHKTSKHVHDIQLADREPTEYELMINLAEIESNLDSELESTTTEMLDYKEKQATAIIMAIIAGKKPQNITVPYKKDQSDYLTSIYDKQFKTGLAQAKNEFDNQGQAEPNKLAKDTRKDRRNIIEDDISVKVEGAGDKLKSMLLEEASSLQRQGIKKADMLSALTAFAASISIQTWQNLSATPVNIGWGDGRAVFVEQHSDMVDYEVYSAILDSNLCDNCRPLDGETQRVGENKFQTPNPICLGGAKCRCVTITIYKDKK